MTKRILITLCTTLLLASCGGDKPADEKKATDMKAEDGAKKPEGDVAAPSRPRRRSPRSPRST